MIQINENRWSVYDPDEILSYKFEGFDTNSLKFGAAIHPREDMMQFNHKESSCIVDFGYYGCEIKLNGVYTVYVVDGNLKEGAWDEPLERIESKDFLKGITTVQEMLNKYT